MSTELPPLRSKKAPAKTSIVDTFRVIRDEPGPNYDTCRKASANGCSATSASGVNILGQPVQRLPPDNEFRHRPAPTNVTCLSSDVRVMMAPIPHAFTKDADPLSPWWQHVSSLKPIGIASAPRTLDSTSRSDYQYRGSGLTRNTRHGCNTYNNPAIIGAPKSFTEEGSGKLFWKERVSYEHQYNCRNDPNYPTRGKRHGSFVWNKMPSADVDRMLSFYGYKDKNDVIAGDTACHRNASRSDQAVEASVPVRAPVCGEEVAAV